MTEDKSKQQVDDQPVLEWLLSHEAYSEFESIHDQEGYSYPEYVDTVKKLIDIGDSPHKLGAAFSAPVGAAIGPMAATFVPKLAEIAQSALLGEETSVDDILKAGAETLKQQVGEKMRQAFTGKDSGIGGVGEGGDGGTSQAGYGGGTPFNPTGLSLNLKPVNSSFKTGIVPLYRPKFFLDGTDDTAPLMIKVINVYPEYESNYWSGEPKINSFIDTALTSSYVNAIMRKVRPNSFTSSVTNTKHIVNYLSIVSYCLAVFYTYTSIIAHFTMPMNRNQGMINLYKQLSVSDLNQIAILRQLLDEVPIDPKLNEFMFHLYGNYKQSHLPGSPLVKNMAFGFVTSPDNEFVAGLQSPMQNCFNLLSSKKFRDFQQLYVQAFPELINSKVMGYSGVPEYDPVWLSHWVNSPYVGQTSNETGMMVPNVSSITTKLPYNLHTDAPDGWIDAASGIFDSANFMYRAGFGGPKYMQLDASGGPNDGFFTNQNVQSGFSLSTGALGYTTAFIYRQDTNRAGTSRFGFWPLGERENSMILSGFTFKTIVSAAGVKTFQRFGTETVEPRTIQDAIPTCQQFIEYMYYPPQMSSTSSFNKFDKNESKGSSRKRKSFKKKSSTIEDMEKS